MGRKFRGGGRRVEGLLTELPLPAGDLPWDERLREMGRSIRQCPRRGGTMRSSPGTARRSRYLPQARP
jgi:hypothetical protein